MNVVALRIADQRDVVTREKRESTLRAECARRGACLWPSTDDHGRPAYIVTRGAATIELPSLDAVAEWIDRLDELEGC